MIKNKKPDAFCDTFTRKGPGQKTTHYCPGCGHGVVHKLIAEAISDLGIQDDVIFTWPVGCSVTGYFYFDTGNIQCPHGRLPAVATGAKRVHKNAIVIGYQGDGDLAGIGMAEIVHAANRGENISIFFINNAIYGMTGGQMAPTSLLGQDTKTTPFGRDKSRDGYPIRVCEMINTFEAPAYIERVTLSTPAGVLKTRKAVRKALLNQKEGIGFSFVEILSPCPINWKMSPMDARRWIADTLEKYYPVKNFRDREDVPQKDVQFPLMNDKELADLLEIHSDEEHPLVKSDRKIGEHKVKIAGFGGQGIMSVGVLLANCIKTAGFNSTWLPSYGAEMRGGTAYASVVASDELIGSPMVDNPDVLIAMNTPSLDAFENDVVKDGIIIVNSSIVSRKVERNDVKAYYIPATEMANKIGLTATAAVIILAFYAKVTGLFDLSVLRRVLPLSIKKSKYVEINIKAVDAGEKYFAENIHP